VPHAGPGAEHPRTRRIATPQQCSTRRTRTGTDLRLGRGECITRGVGTDAAARQAADLEAPPRQTRSRATTVRLGEQSCARHRTLHPSPDTASLAGHDCAPSGTVVAHGVPRLFGSANSRASVAGHCVPRRTRLCPKRHSRGTRHRRPACPFLPGAMGGIGATPVLPDRVPRLFGSANSRASVAGHCVPRRTRLCPKRHSRGTQRRELVG